jgi:hypothetical protein
VDVAGNEPAESLPRRQTRSHRHRDSRHLHVIYSDWVGKTKHHVARSMDGETPNKARNYTGAFRTNLDTGCITNQPLLVAAVTEAHIKVAC